MLSEFFFPSYLPSLLRHSRCPDNHQRTSISDTSICPAANSTTLLPLSTTSMDTKSCNICSLASNSPPQAQPISAPFFECDEDLSTCFIEFAGKIYQIYWKDSMQYMYPDLAHFPSLQEGTTSNPVLLSPPIAELFASSTLLNHGVDGCIRCSHDTELLPIVKIALPRQISRARVQYEIAMLKEMKRCGIPVPEFDAVPLVDLEGEIFGYRMEKLFSLDFKNLGSVKEELKEIVDRLHECGFSHGDLNPSNVMRDGSGRLVLIDPSFSGKIGEVVPRHVPSWQYEGGVFSTATDEKYLERFFR